MLLIGYVVQKTSDDSGDLCLVTSYELTYIL